MKQQRNMEGGCEAAPERDSKPMALLASSSLAWKPESCAVSAVCGRLLAASLELAQRPAVLSATQGTGAA